VSALYFIPTFEDTADAVQKWDIALKQNSKSEGKRFLSITVRRVPVTVNCRHMPVK